MPVDATGRPALETRPPGSSVLTPEQIAASQPGYVAPAPAGYQPPAPAQAYYQPAPAPYVAPAPAPNFAVGSFDVGNKTPEMVAAENAGLKKQLAQAAIYGAAGGQSEFEAMSAWAQTGRTAQQNADLNSALNNPNVPDNIRAMVVGQAMQEFKAAGGAQGPQLVTGDAGTVPGAQHGVVSPTPGIDKGEYQGRYINLRKAGKTGYDPEMQALDKQRMQGYVDARRPA